MRRRIVVAQDSCIRLSGVVLEGSNNPDGRGFLLGVLLFALHKQPFSTLIRAYITAYSADPCACGETFFGVRR
jgi:hypothetical protein